MMNRTDADWRDMEWRLENALSALEIQMKERNDARELAGRSGVRELKLMKKERTLENRIAGALGVIRKFGNTDGGHHKQWILDQVVQSLTGPEYEAWVNNYRDEDDEWDTGVAP